eukprot:4224240-Pyramimonas_sp.AAC.1
MIIIIRMRKRAWSHYLHHPCPMRFALLTPLKPAFSRPSRGAVRPRTSPSPRAARYLGARAAGIIRPPIVETD